MKRSLEWYGSLDENKLSLGVEQSELERAIREQNWSRAVVHAENVARYALNIATLAKINVKKCLKVQ